MNANLQTAPAVTDEELWRLACEGDRDAFTRIVRRYQCLVCSITYGACGALGIAEDMAQETFITAWTGLKDLREPSKLRQWLCGIAQNIADSSIGRDVWRAGEA
jgi:DNA-directed RNA polymerase specialized sigma24 family protein